MSTGRGSSAREGTAKATVADQIAQSIQSTSNLLLLMQQLDYQSSRRTFWRKLKLLGRLDKSSAFGDIIIGCSYGEWFTQLFSCLLTWKAASLTPYLEFLHIVHLRMLRDLHRNLHEAMNYKYSSVGASCCLRLGIYKATSPPDLTLVSSEYIYASHLDHGFGKRVEEEFAVVSIGPHSLPDKSILDVLFKDEDVVGVEDATGFQEVLEVVVVEHERGLVVERDCPVAVTRRRADAP
ncbi:hypothetical protein V2J09_000553 [Rumex salicifolius]